MSPRPSQSKEFYKTIREAIIDGMSADQIVDVFGLDTETLLDSLTNDDLQDHIEALEDYIPRAFEDLEAGEDA